MNAPLTTKPGERDRIIVVIHGIITGETSDAWQNRLKLFVWKEDQEIEVLNREYWEGPTPIFNVFVKNWFCAHALADLLEPYAKAGAKISFVTHSNGADVGLKTIKLLAARGCFTSAVVFIAGAIQADISRNGIAQLIESGRLGRAFAYSSPNDEVLRGWWIWPYGHLGRTGFTNGSQACAVEFDSGKILTRFFPGYGHGSYFYTGNEEKIFTRAIGDCCA